MHAFANDNALVLEGLHDQHRGAVQVDVGNNKVPVEVGKQLVVYNSPILLKDVYATALSNSTTQPVGCKTIVLSESSFVSLLSPAKYFDYCYNRPPIKRAESRNCFLA